MRILTHLHATSTPLQEPCGLTIGTFDGVHLGHQALLRQLRRSVSDTGTVVVLTFTHPPSDLFTHRSTPLLMSVEHKLKLLKEMGVDLVLLVPFTPEFAGIPFDQLLTQLKQQLHFSFFSLGVGASFGKNREGDETHVRALSKALAFQVTYLPKLLVEQEPVSSGRIRTLLHQGALSSVEKLLGRPYSIYAPLNAKGSADKRLLQLALPSSFCFPPDGAYSVEMIQQGTRSPGTAHVEKGGVRILGKEAQPQLAPSPHPVEVVFIGKDVGAPV